jgi:hypothetical protein
MRLLTQIRAVIALLVLASHSPLHPTGVSMFVGRFSRVAVAQQFDPAKAAVREFTVVVTAGAPGVVSASRIPASRDTGTKPTR